MIWLHNGNIKRDKETDPTELEGFKLVNGIFEQQFLPCRHRKISKCAKCEKTGRSKSRPTCKLKGITAYLNCVDCLERDGHSIKE